MPAEAWIAELEVIMHQQREDSERLLSAHTQLQTQVQELEARLAKARNDSHNSGRPPSIDSLQCKPNSLHHRSGKKPEGNWAIAARGCIW